MENEEIEFLLGKYDYLWNEKIWDQLLSFISEYKETHDLGEGLNNLLFMFSEAHRKFKREVKDLSLIMKCRVKGDNDDHFGGRECANFMIDVKDACDKYLMQSEFLDDMRNKNLEKLVKQIRSKAIEDAKVAMRFEEETKQNYLIYGTDNTMDIFDSKFSM